MEKSEIKDFAVKRVAQELKDGDVVNLNIGLPALVPAYLPEGMHAILQSENSITGTETRPTPEEAGPCYKTDAGGQPTQAAPFGYYIDSAISFDFIRGGRVSATILDSLEVDKGGSLSSWIIPDEKMSGVGGAVNLLVGAKKVIVAVEHTAKDNPKILKKCRLPYTTVRCITRIVTEIYVINVTDKGLGLVEINPEFTVEQIQTVTEATLIVPPNLKPIC